MNWNKLERKFGKFAIPNVTIFLILCYVIGYILEYMAPALLTYLTLDPYQIIHGQVWRLITWVLVPPGGFSLLTLITLYFYYSIGTALERTWGTFRYNVFLFGGMLLTILASFICLAVYMLAPDLEESVIALQFYMNSWAFSTYYISMSIFLAFAITYPDVQVLLMFVIPVKVKWMGILDLVLLLYSMFAGGLFTKFAIAASLLNVALFYLSTKNMMHLNPKQVKRRAEFRQQVRNSRNITRHKCAICGRTEEDDPELEFRFCSKCNGNYEFCQYHLFTHEHFK
ncbi:MAG: hypothetical protein K6G30_14300 [Acetatifactor sp.]|nr:hypothetical protein [Acetatifactor sp.]